MKNDEVGSNPIIASNEYYKIEFLGFKDESDINPYYNKDEKFSFLDFLLENKDAD